MRSVEELGHTVRNSIDQFIYYGPATLNLLFLVLGQTVANPHALHVRFEAESRSKLPNSRMGVTTSLSSLLKQW